MTIARTFIESAKRIERDPAIVEDVTFLAEEFDSAVTYACGDKMSRALGYMPCERMKEKDLRALERCYHDHGHAAEFIAIDAGKFVLHPLDYGRGSVAAMVKLAIDMGAA